jgi:hypothetical protein
MFNPELFELMEEDRQTGDRERRGIRIDEDDERGFPLERDIAGFAFSCW